MRVIYSRTEMALRGSLRAVFVRHVIMPARVLPRQRLFSSHATASNAKGHAAWGMGSKVGVVLVATGATAIIALHRSSAAHAAQKFDPTSPSVAEPMLVAIREAARHCIPTHLHEIDEEVVTATFDALRRQKGTRGHMCMLIKNTRFECSYVRVTRMHACSSLVLFSSISCIFLWLRTVHQNTDGMSISPLFETKAPSRKLSLSFQTHAHTYAQPHARMQTRHTQNIPALTHAHTRMLA